MGYLLRFVKAIKGEAEGRPEETILSVQEIKEAEKAIVKLVQKETMPLDQSVISGIHVELGEDGIIRVSSRVKVVMYSESFRCPVFLPHQHPMVDQLIRSVHLKSRHAGVQFVLTSLREEFWILRGRKAVRRLVQGCVRCRRYSVKRPSVVPAALPDDRVRTGRVFEVTGVDLAGPLNIKSNQKAWIVLFTCAVYRCVHLEVVTSLTTEAFMESFSRFTSRRGRPTTVYCDNGTNFVGSNNAMAELDWKWMEKKYGMERIQFRFNPPASPWWGGFWERLVRSVKELLRKSLEKSKLSLWKLNTIICEVEAIINGRPLTTVTEDPEDFAPLTPAMFLQGLPNHVTSDRELLASGFSALFKDRNNLMEQLRCRFRKEYLALLVHRGKEKKVREFRVGEVVLVGADNKKRWGWPMAKVLELIPGRDGHTRVAKLKTAGGYLTGISHII